jgi:hypothetical protein
MKQQMNPADSFTLPGTSMQLNRMGYGAMQLAGPGVWGPPRDIDTALGNHASHRLADLIGRPTGRRRINLISATICLSCEIWLQVHCNELCAVALFRQETRVKRNTIPQIEPLLLTEKQAARQPEHLCIHVTAVETEIRHSCNQGRGHPALFSRRLGLFRYGSPQQRGGGVMARTDALYRRRNYYYFKYKST